MKKSEFVTIKNDYYTFKRYENNKRPTMTLNLTKLGYDKIKHLFNDKGYPISDMIKSINYNSYIWTLYLRMNINKQENYRIYGTCGDWSFGIAAGYYQHSRTGNIKAATAILTRFIEKYLN